MNVNVWKDAWIRKLLGFKPITLVIDLLANLQVCELWVPGLCIWDVVLLSEVFWQEDFNDVLAVLVAILAVSALDNDLMPKVPAH
ncbi:conserved hypothetical protein [Ricinus communis]|uniref:Uncharacterized protein n=1 Tax=Ricinus communis TaxID=3988 RepID=B9SB03_RICCO|nr:conserved hypothetical protein [Ricinus communis]